MFPHFDDIGIYLLQENLSIIDMIFLLILSDFKSVLVCVIVWWPLATNCYLKQQWIYLRIRGCVLGNSGLIITIVMKFWS